MKAKIIYEIAHPNIIFKHSIVKETEKMYYTNTRRVNKGHMNKCIKGVVYSFEIDKGIRIMEEELEAEINESYLKIKELQKQIEMYREIKEKNL